MRRLGRALALVFSALMAAQALPAAEIPKKILTQAYDQAAGRVVAVAYTLKQMEVERGVEGPSAEGILCGVVAAPGTIVIPGDIFPEPGGDPRSTMAPAEFEIHLGADVTVPARAAGLDRRLNLAYLSFDPADAPSLRPVSFRAQPGLHVGDDVIIVGLLARQYGFAPALFQATVNARVEEPVALLGVDALISDLTVGGLVLRRDGTAAGLVVKDPVPDGMDLTEIQGNFISLLANSGQPPFRRPGYAMVMPAGVFAESLASPPEIDLNTEFKRAWLGIIMQGLDKDLIEYWSLPVPGGIIIGSVVEGSPAEAGGLRQGDIITRFDGETIRINENSQLGEFRRKVEKMSAGDEVAVQVYRDGSPVDLSIRLGDAPTTAALAEDYEDEDFGLTVRELTIDVRQAMNLPPDQEGVVIESTESSGWADVAGLAFQDIIMAINGVRVTTVSDVRDALEDIKLREDPEAIFFVLRPPDTLFIRVRTEFGGAGPASSGP